MWLYWKSWIPGPFPEDKSYIGSVWKGAGLVCSEVEDGGEKEPRMPALTLGAIWWMQKDAIDLGWEWEQNLTQLHMPTSDGG